MDWEKLLRDGLIQERDLVDPVKLERRLRLLVEQKTFKEINEERHAWRRDRRRKR